MPATQPHSIMGYHDHHDEGRSKFSLFIEWLVALLLWFPTAIGGWLVHFGMNLWCMLALSCAVAVTGAVRFTFAKNIGDAI